MSEKTASTIVTSENMAEFAAKRLGLTTPTAPAEEPSAAPEAEPVDAASSDDATSEANAEPATEPQPQEKKPNPKLERRFSDLTKQREQARQEAAEERRKREELESRLRELENRAKPATAPVDADEKPTPDKFEDAFEYAEKLAAWSAKQAIREREKAEAAAREQAERAKTLDAWNKRLAQVKAEVPDFDDMIASSDVVVTDPIRDAILESEVGPRLLYHFAENPELAAKLNQMPVAKALRELGKMEATFEKPEKATPAAPRPRAAAPITPLRGVATGAETNVDNDGEFRGSFADYRRLRQAGKLR